MATPVRPERCSQDPHSNGVTLILFRECANAWAAVARHSAPASRSHLVKHLQYHPYYSQLEPPQESTSSQERPCKNTSLQFSLIQADWWLSRGRGRRLDQGELQKTRRRFYRRNHRSSGTPDGSRRGDHQRGQGNCRGEDRSDGRRRNQRCRDTIPDGRSPNQDSLRKQALSQAH